MWLPNDERRLLEGYCARIGGLARELWFKLGALTPLLKCKRPSLAAAGVREYSDPLPADEGPGLPPLEMQRGIREYIELCERIEAANLALCERGLIVITRHEHEQDVFGVSLTVAGYDLGRMYATWFGRTGEWYREYQHHWLWLILSFLGGVIGALLVEVLRNWAQ